MSGTKRGEMLETEKGQKRSPEGKVPDPICHANSSCSFDAEPSHRGFTVFSCRCIPSIDPQKPLVR